MLPGSQIKSTDFVISVEAGEGLTIRDAVYVSSVDGKAYKTDADDLTKIGFAGFVIATVASGATVRIRCYGIVSGFSGLTPNSIYYLSTTAGAITTTRPTNYKIVAQALSTTALRIETVSTKRTRHYTAIDVGVGDSTTRFDITKVSTTVRYTWDGTGTDPVINATTFPAGTLVRIYSQNFTNANNGLFTVIASGANYIEVTNAAGVAENDRTLSSIGLFTKGVTWTKPAGLKRLIVEGLGGGEEGGNASTSGNPVVGGGGKAGGYAIKEFDPSAAAATYQIFVGRGGVSGGATVMPSYFHDILFFASSGLTPTGGDINIIGCPGGPGTNSGDSGGAAVSGQGGDSKYGWGGRLRGNEDNGFDGNGYGAGGGGAWETGGGSGTIGGNGAPGIVIVHEEY